MWSRRTMLRHCGQPEFPLKGHLTEGKRDRKPCGASPLAGPPRGDAQSEITRVIDLYLARNDGRTTMDFAHNDGEGDGGSDQKHR